MLCIFSVNISNSRYLNLQGEGNLDIKFIVNVYETEYTILIYTNLQM
jgi:hypothetical protein